MINWKSIEVELPPCDSETVFIGINTAGYCGCFNEYGPLSTTCYYATPEGCIAVMTDLEWWAELERP